MEETRSSLAEKLETLEEHVSSSVRNTTEAVTGTVEAVKGAVEDTVQSVSESVESVKETFSESVESVKETFDLNRQIQQNPWLVLGGGVLAGYFAGRLLAGGITEVSRSLAPSPPQPAMALGNGHSPRRAEERSEPSTWDKLAETFGPTVEKIQGLALGTATGLVGKMILESIPEALRGEVEHVIDEFTHAVGGKTMTGVLHPNPAESRATAPAARS